MTKACWDVKDRDWVVERERGWVVEKVWARCLGAPESRMLWHRHAKVLDEVLGAPPRNAAGLKHHCGGISFVCVRSSLLYLLTIEERPTPS